MPHLYSCLTIYHVLISISNVLFPYNPIIYVSHLLPLNIRNFFPCQHSILLPPVAISLLIITLFHSLLFSDSILCTNSYPRKNSIFCTVLTNFLRKFFSIFCRSILLHLSFTNLDFSLKLYSYCFLHRSANLILRSFSFSSIAQFSLPYYIFEIHNITNRFLGFGLPSFSSECRVFC